MPSLTKRDLIEMVNRVPEVTISFWIIKVLATTVGETGADYLANTIDPVVAYALIGVAFLAAITGQLRARQYTPWLYWLTVVLISVVGTLITDGLTDGLAISLFTSTAVFVAALIATFAAWYASERTLSIHTIVTAKRERFYWAAILFTFALGTAAGDLIAEQLAVGYGLSVLAFGAMIAAVALAHYGLKLNAVLAFWIAYILTRPLGASLGDLLSQAKDGGGIGLGAMETSGLFLAGIVGLVVFMSIDANRRAARPAITQG